MVSHWSARAAGLFLACLFTGWPAVLSGEPDGSGYAIWPPVGIGLVGLLVIGLRYWLSVWAATFTLGLPIASGVAPGSDKVTIAAAAAIGAGAYAAQAALGAWLIRRWVGYPLPLLSGRDILKFLIVAGPLHTLPAAIVCASIGLTLGAWPGNDGVGLLRQWWWADVVGGLIFAPIAMAVIGEPAEVWRPRRLTVALPIAVAAGAAIGGYWWVRQADDARAAEQLRAEADSAAALLQTDIDRLLVGLEMLRAELTDIPRVGDPDLRPMLVADLQMIRRSSPLIPRVHVAKFVASSDRSRFEEELTAILLPNEGPRDIGVFEIDGSGQMVAAGTRPVYLPVAVVVPREGFTRVLGFDILSDAARREAAEKAVRTNSACSSAPTALVPEPPGKRSVVAVYHRFPADPALPAAGVVGGVFDLRMIQEILGVGRDHRLRFKLDERSAAAPPAPEAGLTHSVPIRIADRDFSLWVSAPPDYLDDHKGQRSGLVATGGFGMVGLLVALLLLLTGQTAVVAEEVLARTLALQEEVSVRQFSEASLRASETRLAEAQRIARIGYWEFDPVERSVHLSPEAADLLGGDAEPTDLTWDEMADLIHPEDRLAFTQLIASAAGGDRSHSVEFRTTLADGSTRWLAAAFRRPEDEDGLLVVQGILQEVTERVAALAAVRASEEQFRQAFESSGIGMALVAPDGRFLRVNAALCRLLGLAESDFLGTDFQSLTHPDDLAADLELVNRCLAGELQSYQMEKRYFHRDGRVIWAILSVALVRDAGGKPTHFISQIQDITARKRAEDELQASEARLTEAQRIARLGYWEYDPRTEELKWSPETYRLFGVKEEEFHPTPESFHELVHPADRAAVTAAAAAALQSESRSRVQFRVVRPDGTIRHMYKEVYVARDGTGRPVRVTGVTQDVTERVEAEIEKRKFEAKLRETQKLESLGVMAGGIAHDFNNLLTGVLGNAALAREVIPPESELHEFLVPIIKSAEHAAHLCQQLLAYAGRGTSTRGPVDLNRLAEETADLLRVSVPKSAELRFELGPDLPVIRADAGQLRQVLLNLVHNAAEALDGKGGTVTIATGAGNGPPSGPTGAVWSGEPPHDRHVWLDVADTGHGMAADTLSRVFEPFFTTKFTGRGLGLSAVHGIVRSHGGAIMATSTVGCGTRFRVYLPLESTAEEEAEADTAVATAGVCAVLVAEPEAAYRATAVAALKAQGLTVVETPDGRDAIERVRRDPGRFKLAVLGLTIAGGDETDALRELRRIAPDLPVIVTGTYPANRLSDRDEADGVQYLEKPFGPADLTACVRRLLGRTPRSTPPEFEEPSFFAKLGHP